METPSYSVVIPVYNSEAVVADTVLRTVKFFEQFDELFEIILVNDASPDNSWNVIADIARRDPRVIAINLLRNSGQHAANLCGFRASRGRWLVTMDDDLQNPPEEIARLVEKAEAGHDLVIGRFRQKQHAGYRKLGSRVIRELNRRIFGQPRDLTLSNFRLIRRDVVDRINAYRGPYPYIPGLCLLYAARAANADVEHHSRKVGSSNYNWRKIAFLVSAILFNYSSFPLRVVAAVGMGVATIAFALGIFYLVDGMFSKSQVPGWTTLVVLLAFLNGVLMVMVAILGEYVVRILNQISVADPYMVAERVDADA
ncbi:glycosyltransferase family 2 protein [Luteimonas mephitis]|uniref:glycosyltransferase family 2 protein n=1 Tax=Luteimonas mephitis TaxID=83615 RepID=UPI00047DE0E2|nr:glycosyltransferase family 2 protein [Luteimonas mephitis]